MYADTDSQADAQWVPALETCMFVQTHMSLLPNCFLLATEIFFLALMAAGIYKHNPGPRAFKVMYREVRAFLSLWSCASETSHLFYLRACYGL